MPLTEPIDRIVPSVSPRFRRVLFGAAFICIGALASALTTKLLQAGRASFGDASEASRREPAVSVATLAAPLEVPVRPAPPASVADGKAASLEEQAPERVRPTRRSTPAHVSRRSQGTPRRVEPRSESSRVAAAGTATLIHQQAPAASGAAPAPVAAPASTDQPPPVPRRQGANGSPLLD